jgi:hypothetical protein
MVDHDIDASDAALHEIRGARSDSLGEGTVVYWPNIPAEG